jgi:hypothetical protein
MAYREGKAIDRSDLTLLMSFMISVVQAGITSVARCAATVMPPHIEQRCTACVDQAKG